MEDSPNSVVGLVVSEIKLFLLKIKNINYYINYNNFFGGNYYINIIIYILFLSKNNLFSSGGVVSGNSMAFRHKTRSNFSTKNPSVLLFIIIYFINFLKI